jgi:hypothetical protein
MRHLALLLLLVTPVCSAQSEPPLKVKIQATLLDSKVLLEKLNSNGASHHLKFILADEFDYRIVFSTAQKPVSTAYGDINASTASTSVFDSNGTELFNFERAGRWTDTGAANAAAKELIKRLVKLRKMS